MAGRLQNCMAYTFPESGTYCGQPTDQLLRFACGQGHYKLLSTCQVHTDILVNFEAGTVLDCVFCEDVFGRAEPMSIQAVDPYREDHPILLQIARDRHDLDSL